MLGVAIVWRHSRLALLGALAITLLDTVLRFATLDPPFTLNTLFVRGLLVFILVRAWLAIAEVRRLDRDNSLRVFD
jgi:hypothetical protein